MSSNYTLGGFQPRETGDAATAQPLASGRDFFDQTRPYLYSPGTRVVSALIAASLGWACVAEWREPHPHVEPDGTVALVNPAPLTLTGSVSGFVPATYVIPWRNY